MISCILLSAGESLRFGSPKALAQIGNQTVIEILQKKLIESLVDEVIIVTGAHRDQIKSYVFNHSKVRLVHNKDYKLGQTSSFQTGLKHISQNSEGFMLAPVDCPLIKITTINQLVSQFQSKKPSILLPTYKNKRGHPPIFNAFLKETLLGLSADQGLNSIFPNQAISTKEINDPGIALTFNTKEELLFLNFNCKFS